VAARPCETAAGTMRIANPARQMKGNPHFLNSIMAIGVVVLPVCLYYVVAKQPEEQKEMVSVRTARGRALRDAGRGAAFGGKQHR